MDLILSKLVRKCIHLLLEPCNDVEDGTIASIAQVNFRISLLPLISTPSLRHLHVHLVLCFSADITKTSAILCHASYFNLFYNPPNIIFIRAQTYLLLPTYLTNMFQVIACFSQLWGVICVSLLRTRSDPPFLRNRELLSSSALSLYPM